MAPQAAAQGMGLPPPSTASTGPSNPHVRWIPQWGNKTGREPRSNDHASSPSGSKGKRRWTMGILDAETEEVPGSVLLLSKASEYNEPLGLRNAPARTSASSLPSPYPPSITSSIRRRHIPVSEKKRTKDGKIVLEPQPDDSHNDPLNWSIWRRDLALLSLGFYCMVGGGMTTVLAAGFKEVAADYHISVPRVALSTGLYMMGLGLGSVVLAPTAILFGKRPVYLVAATCFILTSIWCALSPNFPSLIVARIFQGLSVSSVECLPSATVAEIYFLHEKAYRLGIYTLLLLGGKNLVPLVCATIIESMGWRWVFYIVAMVVGLGLCLLFFFVPETFWDRTPRPHRHLKRRISFTGSNSVFKAASRSLSPSARRKEAPAPAGPSTDAEKPRQERHAHFQINSEDSENEKKSDEDTSQQVIPGQEVGRDEPSVPTTPAEFRRTNTSELDYFNHRGPPANDNEYPLSPGLSSLNQTNTAADREAGNPYVQRYVSSPPKSFLEQLKPYSGRLSHDNWFKVAARPFLLYAYPSILWSALVYSLSIGWLIVLSESVATIYENRATYNFNPLQVGLVYLSPFIGGILGTAVAGKVSDVIVRAMAARNGGIYEPEYRLVMGIPIAISTTIGLMGYGWSAQEHDHWIVPTIFFGFISFGCSLGSTTSVTFAVDSYRQYAGEALVTLNFSKNILHGLVWSLFFNKWLDADGSKRTFVAIGGIQLACLLTTIPMYIYGKRARMWTVKRNFMEKL